MKGGENMEFNIKPYCSEPNVRHEVLADGICVYCNEKVKQSNQSMFTVYYCNACEKYTKDLSHKHSEEVDLLYIGSVYTDADYEVWQRYEQLGQTA